jgi:hypothetical protein
MDTMPIFAVRAMPVTFLAQTGALQAAVSADHATPPAQGDQLQVPPQGGLPAALRQKISGTVPGSAISFESQTAPDVAALRQAALQARQPRGITHNEAVSVRRTALMQLQAGSQAGSPVAAIAGATLGILDGSAGVGLFRLTEFTDRVLDWVAGTPDHQFVVTPGNTAADGLRALANGLTETRGADPTSDGPAYASALNQAARLAAPGSFVAGLVLAHESLAKQLTSPRDKATLAEQALLEFANVTAYDMLMGGGGKALRTLARQANWTLTMTNADRIALKSAALRTIAGQASVNSKVAYVANDALRIVAGASSITEQDSALKAALDLIATAVDSDF